ncbi:MAG: hypothetical protein OEL81_09450, partial [Nitrosopumilus sp.]|nr:hypothetical protein [Nitrosopumilus sp.]
SLQMARTSEFSRYLELLGVFSSVSLYDDVILDYFMNLLTNLQSRVVSCRLKVHVITIFYFDDNLPQE